MYISESIFSDLNNILASSSSKEDLLHTFHIHYEKIVFDSLKTRYLQKLKKYWLDTTLPLISKTDRCIVIYETRCHPNLEFLIYNLTYFAKEWGLIIYCSKANYNFINDILQHNKFRAILYIVREDEGGKEVRNEYNEFVKSSIFWNSLPCSYIMMCEMDAYLRKPVPDDILLYDYVCCKWPWHSKLAGGGGISFRKVSSMKKICNQYPSLATDIFAQDCWAAEGCIYLNLIYNNTYLVEASHNIDDPIGLHNWWTFIDPVRLSSWMPVYDKYLTICLD
jgi:hypothetical protein